MRAVLINPDDKVGKVIDLPVTRDQGSLTALQDLVGGSIEHVQLVRTDGGGMGMYVHDEGMIRRLPVNRLATGLYWRTRAVQPPPGTLPYAIHGPAVVLAGPDYEGDDLPIDEGWVATLHGLGVHVEGDL
jgi:hypothetical protein